MLAHLSAGGMHNEVPATIHFNLLSPFKRPGDRLGVCLGRNHKIVFQL